MRAFSNDKDSFIAIKDKTVIMVYHHTLSRTNISACEKHGVHLAVPCCILSRYSLCLGRGWKLSGNMLVIKLMDLFDAQLGLGVQYFILDSVKPQ